MLKCSCCSISQAPGLLLHPCLGLVFHVLLVFPTAAVSSSQIMGRIDLTVLTIKLRHVAPQAIGYPVPHCPKSQSSKASSCREGSVLPANHDLYAVLEVVKQAPGIR